MTPTVAALCRFAESDYQRYLAAHGLPYASLQRARLGEALRRCRTTGRAGSGWALWEPLAWDSERLGCRVARISHLLVPAGARRRASGLQVLRRTIRAADRTTDLLTLRLDGDDLSLLQAAEQCGFVTVDHMHTFFAARGAVRSWRCLPAGTRVNAGSADDLPALRRIARQAFAHSRIYQDPRISAARAARFYADLTSAIAGQSVVFLVARRRGVPAGFALGTVDGLMPQLGYLWLIAVAPESRGLGVGRALLGAFFRAMFRQVEAVEISTQCANAAATRLYAGCGLLPQARLVTLHRWRQAC